LQRATITVVIILCLAFAGSANAAGLITKPKNHTLKAIFTSQTKNLKYSKYICRHGDNQNQRWHCKAKVWLLKEWKQTYSLLHPDIRTYIETRHPCLAQIIAHENEAYDPTLDYGGGHGNVDEPYGIPQATPGRKMQSAGKDWATNPFTQLRWMINYARERYGGDCAALSHKLSYGWY
jgi:hypothetical protein